MVRPHLTPSSAHPITITPYDGRVVVRLGDRVLADTERALELREASYPPVLYVPREDADAEAFAASTKQTYCPYKGDASYPAIRGEDGDVTGAVWTYEEPYDAVAPIAGHLAFYPDKVTIDAG